MATTYTLISSQTIASNTSVITFSSIPQTYTDLVLKCSIRAFLDGADFTATLTLNGSSASTYSNTELRGNGSASASSRYSNQSVIYLTNGVGGGTAVTANTFNNLELCIPSYTANQYKPLSSVNGNENNSATAYITATAGLWRDNSAITSLSLECYAAPNSTFYLYGIKNS